MSDNKALLMKETKDAAISPSVTTGLQKVILFDLMLQQTPVVFSALHLSGKQRRLLLIVELEAYARAANQAKPLPGGLIVQMCDTYK